MKERLSITPFGKSFFENHKIKGVLFDMDGVIIDTEKLYTRFWIEAGRFFGFPMTLEHGLALRSLDHKEGQRRFQEWFGPEADHTKIRNKRIELMNAFIAENGVEKKQGIHEIIAYLEEHEIPFCIATSSPIHRVDQYLTQLGLRQHFKHIVTSRDVERGKPFPDIYLLAAKELNLAPEDCIAVEDSHNGLLSAWNAGAAPVMIPDQDQPTEEMLKIIAAKADSLKDLILLFEGN